MSEIDDLKRQIARLEEEKRLYRAAYGVLKKVLVHFGFEILEDSRGLPEVGHLHLKGYLPTDPTLAEIIDPHQIRH